MSKELRQSEIRYENNKTQVLEIATDPKWAGIKPNIAKMILNLSGLKGLAATVSDILKRKANRKAGNWQ